MGYLVLCVDLTKDLGHGLKEPEGFVFKDKDFHNIGSSGNASAVNPPTLDGKLNAGDCSSSVPFFFL